ncbi:hypothetical protein CNQ84_13655 [Pseudomonas abyssi]|uniref:GspL periplasmic domain-containing protein n=1 Tax=Pseudomonas abyssi TaxID=170540 RepID=A0A2A3MFN6_9PSED|nr:hypothetical protein CNQ84_13655 [Pseudomonas abyssi]
MSMPQQVDLLRLLLPPLHDAPWDQIACVGYASAGGWHSAVYANLAAIKNDYKPRRVEVCLHPGDLSMAELVLPPLPAKRQRSAVLGALELLALDAPESLAVGFGRRGEDGKVPVCWTANSTLQTAVQTLQQHGLPVQALLPAPAFLPVASAALLDGWVVARTCADRGIMHPLPPGQHAPVDAEARLQQLFEEPPALQWLAGEGVIPWTGADWPWALTTGKKTATSGQPRHWLRPALAWATAATAVWLLGLNVYAEQVASEGRDISRNMAAQVKAAFPEVSMVINPLQQARQMRDARQSGDGVVNEPAFPALARATVSLLTDADGQVQRVQYRNGQMDIQWREGAALRPEELQALQTQAYERGLNVQPSEAGIRLQVDTSQTNPVASPEGISPVPPAPSVALQ